MKGSCRLSVLFAFLLIALASCVQHNIQVTLEISNYEINLVEQREFPVDITYENKGEEISLPHFAIARNEILKERMFEITSTSTGRKPVYIGAVAKRRITPSSLFSLPPLRPLSSQVDLLSFYHFEEDGTYLVQLNAIVPMMEGSIHLSSNIVQVVVKGSSPYTGSPLQKKRVVTFTSCDTTQQNTMNVQFPKQRDALTTATTYLNNNCNNSDYVDYFGVFDSSRYSTVKTHFTNINSLANSANFGINCNGPLCNTDTYAYVFPTDTSTHTIYLCSAFWSASDDQYTTDSKAGTLTHEMSHFQDIASTLDVVYGLTNALALAASDPASAITNADNYEYFQEGRPACDVVPSPSTSRSPSASPSTVSAPSPSNSPSPSRSPSSSSVDISSGLTSFSSVSSFTSFFTSFSSYFTSFSSYFTSFSSFFTSFSSTSFSSTSFSSNGSSSDSSLLSVNIPFIAVVIAALLY